MSCTINYLEQKEKKIQNKTKFKLQHTYWHIMFFDICIVVGLLKVFHVYSMVLLAAATLGELTGLFPINQLKLKGFNKILMQPHILSFN